MLTFLHSVPMRGHASTVLHSDVTWRQWPAIRYHHVSLISSKGTQVKLISAVPTKLGKVTQFSLAFVQEEQGMIIDETSVRVD